MKNTIKYIIGLVLTCLIFTQCGKDYLTVSSPSNTDDEFVTSSADEAAKILNYMYGQLRDCAGGGNYGYNDPCGSDIEYYPESNSPNSVSARLMPENMSINQQTNINTLYKVSSYAKNFLSILESKSEYTEARDKGETNDWTQLYGEATVLRAYSYAEMVRHWGDVPYNYENTTAEEYTLTNRWEILDEMIAAVEKVADLMYAVGEGGVDAQRATRSYAYALMGEMCYLSAGYQTIRTDVSGLYDGVSYTQLPGSTSRNDAIYVRRNDYKDYYAKAIKYFDKAMGDAVGTVQLITSDERSYADNPFQRVFQYCNDLGVSPESYFEIACIQGSHNCEREYSQGRPSGGGGSNAAPCKVFGACRMNPIAYYTLYEDGDKRWDASAVVTGSNGKGQEVLLGFKPGSKTDGGISNNKWDPNKMNPPYYTKQRQSGMNYVQLRMADVMLMDAVCEAIAGSVSKAQTLVNQIRARAFGDNNHNVSFSSTDAALEAIYLERRRELLFEGDIRWDMILSGEFLERGNATRAKMEEVMAALQSQGYYTFDNGRTFPAYIWTKRSEAPAAGPRTYDSVEGDPVMSPGWRGQYDYTTISAIASKLASDDDGVYRPNLAIEGLFEYIDPNGSEAAALEADGYTKVEYGILWAKNKTDYMQNCLEGLGLYPTGAPLYYYPLPSEIISQSKGNVTNGYGMPQE